MRAYFWTPLVASAIVACGPSNEVATPDCDWEGQVRDSQSQPIVLLACPVNTVFSPAAAIPVRVALQNISDTTIWLRPSFVFGAWLDAEIEGPEGVPIASSAHIHAGMEARINLRPGDRTEAIVDLNCAVGSPTSPGGCIRPYNMDQKGTYVVRMRYSYRCGVQGSCKADSLTVEGIEGMPFEIVVR